MLNRVWPCTIHKDMINRFKSKILNFGEICPYLYKKCKLNRLKHVQLIGTHSQTFIDPNGE